MTVVDINRARVFHYHSPLEHSEDLKLVDSLNDIAQSVGEAYQFLRWAWYANPNTFNETAMKQAHDAISKIRFEQTRLLSRSHAFPIPPR